MARIDGISVVWLVSHAYELRKLERLPLTHELSARLHAPGVYMIVETKGLELIDHLSAEQVLAFLLDVVELDDVLVK